MDPDGKGLNGISMSSRSTVHYRHHRRSTHSHERPQSVRSSQKSWARPWDFVSAERHRNLRSDLPRLVLCPREMRSQFCELELRDLVVVFLCDRPRLEEQDL